MRTESRGRRSEEELISLTVVVNLECAGPGGVAAVAERKDARTAPEVEEGVGEEGECADPWLDRSVAPALFRDTAGCDGAAIE